LPGVGSVSNNEAEEILKRGLLNDVATAFYIRGASAEEVGNRDLAIASYSGAVRYTYARTWDPKYKTFWSPAKAAQDRLRELQPTK